MFKQWFRRKTKTKTTPPMTSEQLPPPPPDVGLEASYELVHFLGRGGSGNTWLYRSRDTGELVAIKLIARPFPKVILPAQVEREIKVWPWHDEGRGFQTRVVCFDPQAQRGTL